MSAALAKAGFTILPEGEDPRRIVASTASGQKTGKTHFATTWPKPQGWLITDTGSEEVIRKRIREGSIRRQDIVLRTFEIPETYINREAQPEYQKAWQSMCAAYLALVGDPSIRTLVVDTFTEMWEMARLAAFGKLTQVLPQHYGPLNSEFRGLMKEAYARKDLNILYIHKVKKEYKEGKKGDSNWTGNWERAGFGDAQYLVDVNMENFYEGGEQRQFGVRLFDCRQNPDAIALELDGEMATFGWIASAIWPDTLNTDWE
jgi:hypothetical protein